MADTIQIALELGSVAFAYYLYRKETRERKAAFVKLFRKLKGNSNEVNS